MRVLNIAEKPSVAKELAAILAKGAAQRATSKSKFNPAFQFEFSLRGQRVTMVVTSVSGHMMSLDVVPEYQTWRSCDPARLFDVPVIKFVQKDHQDVDSNIRHHAKSCQMLVLWLDCDREGENIAFEVIQRCTEVNPRLQILRARFSALIPRCARMRESGREWGESNRRCDAIAISFVRARISWRRTRTKRSRSMHDRRSIYALALRSHASRLSDSRPSSRISIDVCSAMVSRSNANAMASIE